jgi:hypothetical protein
LGTTSWSLVGHQHQRLTAEVALHRGSAQRHDLCAFQRRGKLARELEQRARAPLAAGRHAGRKAQAGRELPHQQADAEHDREGQHVLHVAHRQRQRGGTKKNRRPPR